MFKLILCSAFVLLGACATTPPPKPEVQQVYCVTPEQYAQIVSSMPPSVKDQLTGQAQKDYVIMTKSRIALKIYADGVVKILGGCIGPAPSAS